MIKRRSVLTGCLILLWTTVSAQQNEKPKPRTPTAPDQHTGGARETPIPPASAQPAPIRTPQLAPSPFQPPQAQPTTVTGTTEPATIPVLPPVPSRAPSVPPIGSDLRNKLKEDKQHFGEKSASAKHEFDLRQAEEKKAFEATPRDTGFWETRRLNRQFREAQAKTRREFTAEQETNRRTYEWRYP